MIRQASLTILNVTRIILNVFVLCIILFSNNCSLVDLVSFSYILFANMPVVQSHFRVKHETGFLKYCFLINLIIIRKIQF
jgi:hypothetical protein